MRKGVAYRLLGTTVTFFLSAEIFALIAPFIIRKTKTSGMMQEQIYAAIPRDNSAMSTSKTGDITMTKSTAGYLKIIETLFIL